MTIAVDMGHKATKTNKQAHTTFRAYIWSIRLRSQCQKVFFSNFRRKISNFKPEIKSKKNLVLSRTVPDPSSMSALR